MRNPPNKVKAAICYARYLSKPEGRFRNMLTCAKRRAIQSGIEFDDELYTLLLRVPTHCQCCGNAMEYTVGRGLAGRRKSPSLDRLENDKGYTLENTRVVCYRCNEVKGDAVAIELKVVLAYMERELK